jgi:SAM-dependent methyltransferase
MSAEAPLAEDSRQVLFCPACGGVNKKAVGPRGAAFVTQLRRHAYTQPAYDILECVDCGLLYKSHVLSDQLLGDYYSEVDYRKWEIPGLFPTERLVREELLGLSMGSRILDVGCSSGRLLCSLPAGYELFGVEPNAAASDEAAKKGVLILPNLDGSDVPPFDAIVLMDVFEHLTEPARTLATLVGRIKPGGRLIMATGDGDHSLCRESPAEFWYFRNIEHVCMLTRSFAGYLERRLNLRMTRWRVSSHYDSSFLQRFVRRLRLFAFRQAGAQTVLWRVLLRFLPMFGRAAQWKECPAYDLGEDHVVVVFSKN